MTTFVMLTADALDQKFIRDARFHQRLSDASGGASGYMDKNPPIRRPHRGIQIKEDTYATMSIVDANGNILPLISESYTGLDTPEGRGMVQIYADFIIQQIEEERVEKQQVVETFGDSFIFFFGERPRLVTIRGLLVNSEDFNWRSQFWENYDKYLRGTKLVQRNARAYLAWDSIVIEGYPINASASEDSNQPHLVQFQMTFFLTNYNDFGRIGVVDFPEDRMDFNSFEALNKDLDEKAAKKRLPTGLAVRAANLNSAFDGIRSLNQFMGEVTKPINSVMNTVGGFLKMGETVLSGRVVRTPLGVAGFLAQIEPGALVAAGTLTPGFYEGLAELGLTDVKVRIPQRSRFTKVPEKVLRGRISQNVDEYPLSQHTFAKNQIEPDSPIEQILQARAVRRKAVEGREAEFVAQNLLAQEEGELLQSLADVVNLAKAGFALALTAVSFAADPGAVALDALGLSDIDSIL